MTPLPCYLLLSALLFAIGLAPDNAVQKMKAVVALGDTEYAMAFRRAVWSDSLPIIRDHPLLGTGPTLTRGGLRLAPSTGTSVAEAVRVTFRGDRR